MGWNLHRGQNRPHTEMGRINPDDIYIWNQVNYEENPICIYTHKMVRTDLRQNWVE